MELRYTVIDPTKNITLLVTTPMPRDVQPRVAAELLRREKDAEQVGFATFSDAFTFVLLIVILVFKPTGLFGEKTTDKV